MALERDQAAEGVGTSCATLSLPPDYFVTNRAARDGPELLMILPGRATCPPSATAMARSSRL